MLNRVMDRGARFLVWLRENVFWILGFLLLAGFASLGVVMLGVNQFLWSTLIVVGGGAVLTGVGCVTSRTFREWLIDTLKSIGGQDEESEEYGRRLIEEDRLATERESKDPADEQAEHEAQIAVYKAQEADYKLQKLQAEAELRFVQAEEKKRLKERQAANVTDDEEGTRKVLERGFELQFIGLLRDAVSEFKAGDWDEKQGIEFQDQVQVFMQEIKTQYGSSERGGVLVGEAEQILKLNTLVFLLNMMLQVNREKSWQARATGLPTEALIHHQAAQASQPLFAQFVSGPEFENLKAFLTDPVSKAFLIDPVVLSSGYTVNRSTAQRLYELGFTICPMSQEILVEGEEHPDYTRKSLYDLFVKWGVFDLLQDMFSPSVGTVPDLDERIHLMCGMSPVVSSDGEEKVPLLREPSMNAQSPLYANARGRGSSSVVDLAEAKKTRRSRSSPLN